MRLFLTFCFSLFLFSAFAQNDYSFTIEPVSVSGLNGAQSYAFGRTGNTILIIGGRTDGLHRRQPPVSFDANGRNMELSVLDLETQEVWTSGLEDWPAFIADQLGSSNMEFHQVGDYLYLIGGYGYSEDQDDHITHPQLIAIDIPQTINAIQSGEDFMDHFRYLEDDYFAVTGGYLLEMNDIMYLVGGHKFEGRYNPMNGPSFTQEYSNSVKKFTIDDDGENINIEYLEPYEDDYAFHRRDLNVLAQVYDGDTESLMLFSGVFQTVEDIPYLDCVEIREDGYNLISDFNQYYNHYHCATIGMYSDELNEMSSVFFGGMAQFYDNDGVLTEDINVPFVKTIAAVKRNSDGSYAEYKLGTEMPDLLGASAEMILLDDIPMYPNGVINFDAITEDTTLLGYIYGGIESSGENIFWINDGTQSEANSILYAVTLEKNVVSSSFSINSQSNNGIKIQSYVDFVNDVLHIKADVNKQTDVQIEVFTIQGKLLYEYYEGPSQNGKHDIEIPVFRIESEFLIVTLRAGDETITQKINAKF